MPDLIPVSGKASPTVSGSLATGDVEQDTTKEWVGYVHKMLVEIGRLVKALTNPHATQAVTLLRCAAP